MRTSHYGQGLLAALALAGLMTACDKGPVPTPIPRPNQGPNTNPQPSVTKVELNGPASVAPGESVHFTAKLYLSDGSSRDGNSEVKWTSTNTAVLRVDSAGLVTGVRTGEARIMIRWNNTVNAWKDVIAVPAGTFRMIGAVTEDIVPPTPIVGAQVDVVDGSTAILSATTDWDGRYRLYGVPADSEIRITRSGYQPFLRAVQLTGHTTRDFQLALANQRPDISGTYSLTLGGGGCSGSPQLAEELRQRTYTAVLTQNGPRVDVVLSGPAFAVNKIKKGNAFSGFVDPGGVTFKIAEGAFYYYYYYGPEYYPDVVERLANSTLLVVTGTAKVAVTANGLSGTLDGSLVNYRDGFPQVVNTLGSCWSRTFPFTLVR